MPISVIYLLSNHEDIILTCTSDQLAKHIKTDFPIYSIRAGPLKNLNTPEKVKKAFGLYDNVIIPVDMNDDNEFLESFPFKERIMVFANATCAYHALLKFAIQTFSVSINTKRIKEFEGKGIWALTEKNFIFFDVEKFHLMGFPRFKLVPVLLLNYAH